MLELIPIIVLATVAATVIYFINKSKKLAKKKPKKEKYSARPFQQHTKEYTKGKAHAAVTIAYPVTACEAVKALNEKRFLVRKAPLLPLRDCTQTNTCECKYMHHADRRKVKRRPKQ